MVTLVTSGGIFEILDLLNIYEFTDLYTSSKSVVIKKLQRVLAPAKMTNNMPMTNLFIFLSVIMHTCGCCAKKKIQSHYYIVKYVTCDSQCLIPLEQMKDWIKQFHTRLITGMFIYNVDVK